MREGKSDPVRTQKYLVVDHNNLTNPIDEEFKLVEALFVFVLWDKNTFKLSLGEQADPKM